MWYIVAQYRYWLNYKGAFMNKTVAHEMFAKLKEAVRQKNIMQMYEYSNQLRSATNLLEYFDQEQLFFIFETYMSFIDIMNQSFSDDDLVRFEDARASIIKGIL